MVFLLDLLSFMVPLTHVLTGILLSLTTRRGHNAVSTGHRQSQGAKKNGHCFITDSRGEVTAQDHFISLDLEYPCRQNRERKVTLVFLPHPPCLPPPLDI